MAKYLLDTDISIYTIKRKPHTVKRRFNAHAGDMAISSVTLGELFYGAANSENQAHNIKVVEGYAARLALIDYDKEAAMQFAQLKIEIKSEPIGAYDLMIAAQARSRGMILVTNNLKEFERVPGLRVESWV